MRESQNTLIQDSRFDMTSPIKLADESNLPSKLNENTNENAAENTEERKKMSKDEIDSLVDNKRSELDINLFDLVTRNQIEEKKVEDIYNNEENDETKAKLLKELEELIKKNESMISEMKE